MIISKLKNSLLNTIGIRYYKNAYLPKGIDWIYDAYRLAQENFWDIEIIFDVGANVGDMSIALSKLFKNTKIYAFEPISKTFNILESRIKGTHDCSTRIIPINCGLGNVSGQFNFFTNSSCSEISKLNISKNTKSLAEAYDGIELCDVTKIDAFATQHNLQRIDLIKTDTEGFDLDVMKGAINLIEHNPPKIITSEVDFDRLGLTDFQVIKEFLSAFGYHLYGLYDYWHTNKNQIKYCNAMFVQAK